MSRAFTRQTSASSKAEPQIRRFARSSALPRGWGESSSWNSFPRNPIPAQDNRIVSASPDVRVFLRTSGAFSVI